MVNRVHLTRGGLRRLQKIVNLRVSINLGGSESLIEVFPNIVPVERPVIEDIAIDDPYSLGGLLVVKLVLRLILINLKQS